MKKTLIKLYWLLSSQFGFDPLRLMRSLRALPHYLRDHRAFRSSHVGTMHWMPCLHDRYTEAGVTKSEYFWQDLLVARWIHDAAPLKHVDIGSRVDGFVAHVASFREIEVFDVRPITTEIPGVTFRQADLMNPAFVSAWLDENAGGATATRCRASMCSSTSGSVATAIPSTRTATRKALPTSRACSVPAHASTCRRRSVRSASSSTPIGSSIRPPSCGLPTGRGCGWSGSQSSMRALACARFKRPSASQHSRRSPASTTTSASSCSRDPWIAQRQPVDHGNGRERYTPSRRPHTESVSAPSASHLSAEVRP